MELGQLDELYARFAPLVYRRALRLLGREPEAWDVVHDVFERLLRQGAAFRGESTPLTYVYRVTTNLALNALRARAVRELAAEPEPSFDPADVEARSVLAALARELDEESAQIAALHFFDGLSQEEIADVVQLSRKTVGRKLAAVRARAQEISGATG